MAEDHQDQIAILDQQKQIATTQQTAAAESQETDTPEPTAESQQTETNQAEIRV